MIEVSNIGKRYGSLEAVKNVSLRVGSGEIVGLLGPNGAGKTTIIRILTCYHFPSSGSACVNSFDIFKQPLQVKRSVGYLPENAPVYTDLNVMEYLDFIAEARSIPKATKKQRIDWAVEECGLKPVLYRTIDKLSKGYKQRAGLAQAIIHDPAILILDEPTTGLDPNQIIEIRNLIKKLGREKTVILSTHILQEVEAVCDRVFILNEGEIAAQGTTEEIGSEMKGDDIFGLTLTGSSEDVSANLVNLDGVSKVINIEAPAANRVDLRLSMAANKENAERIFDWAVDSKHKILAMSLERFSLEDIFIQLTGDKQRKEGGGDND